MTVENKGKIDSDQVLTCQPSWNSRSFQYDSGHNLFSVENRFHVDIEQIREGLVLFGGAPWENGLPEPGYDEGPFLNEGQTDMWEWDLWQKME